MNDPRRAAAAPRLQPVIQPAVAQDTRAEQLVDLVCALEARFALTLLNLLYEDRDDEETKADLRPGEAG